MLDVGLGGVLTKAVEEQVAACQELLAQAAEVGLPPGLRHDVEGRCLEHAADVHRVGSSVGEDAFAGWAPGDDGGDAECRGHALGERAKVDDVAGVVACGDRGGGGGDAEVVRPVVLNEEGAVLTNDVEDLALRVRVDHCAPVGLA